MKPTNDAAEVQLLPLRAAIERIAQRRPVKSTPNLAVGQFSPGGHGMLAVLPFVDAAKKLHSALVRGEISARGHLLTVPPCQLASLRQSRDSLGRYALAVIAGYRSDKTPQNTKKMGPIPREVWEGQEGNMLADQLLTGGGEIYRAVMVPAEAIDWWWPADTRPAGRPRSTRKDLERKYGETAIRALALLNQGWSLEKASEQACQERGIYNESYWRRFKKFLSSNLNTAKGL
jgi:hypothetical protein